MSNVVKDAAESTFQENFVQELTKHDWVAPEALNGNLHEVSVDDLINNWRVQLNRINADQLEGQALTDAEFDQVMMRVRQISNSYEAAKMLSIEESTGKIDGIFRDSGLEVTREQITLTIFKKAEVHAGDSTYQIAREVKTDHGNRFDIVLLINGLPLINIEQKRTDKNLEEAFGQFQRYYRDGEYSNNFMAFSQMMVLSSEVDTRYFATPKSIDDFNPSFVFHWADKQNRPINDWREITQTLLKIPMAHQMVGDYLVIDEAKDPENQRHMLMRPYQVYALQAIEAASKGRDVDSGIAHGGFIWHTTGSGKTITSFKTALFLSTRLSFGKVVFLVDRRELDSNTSDSFKNYSKYEAVDVDDTSSTNQLKKRLRQSKSGIVVTTTFKLNSLVKEMVENHDYSLADQKLIFIIDEAHRTTMGQMMGDIKHYFRKYGLFFGFTGTPLFDENKVKGKVNAKSEVINTTTKLFGPELHRYTIEEAIADGNVLGFHVDYVNTGEFKSYDDLRDKLIEKQEEEHPEKGKREIERKVQQLSNLEVEQAAVKDDLLVYQDETHIPRVVTDILNQWESQSQARQFNGILTVAYKERVIAYYKEFKRQMADRDEKINIAMTFSFGNENDPDNVATKVVKEMFTDYGEFTGIHFEAGNQQHGESAYFEDLTERAKKGGSGRNPKNIDLVIVADQLLTGYDSKRLNTLYVDRSLELQGLIQAYSRTNRVFGASKEFGTIINFQLPKVTEATVDQALTLYGSGGKNNPAIVDVYENAVKKLKIAFDELRQTLTDPTRWQEIKDDEEAKKGFEAAFKDASSQANIVEQYYEFKWVDETFGMSEHLWMQYIGAYKNLFPREPIDIKIVQVRDLAGKTQVSGSQVIDAAHILKLIGQKVDTTGKVQTVDDETLRIIYEQIQELSNMGQDIQAKLLLRFVKEELVPGNLSADVNFDEAYDLWKQSLEKEQVDHFAAERGIDADLLQKSVTAFSIGEPDVVPYIDEITTRADFGKAKDKSAGNQLMHTIKLTGDLAQWMLDVKQRYN
ncbi:type I restriction-modification system restriction subunit R [Ligilactobacillus salitolerans]|uniref:Type I restriction enzyme endonuclease subunit n=1 Tax=Ligilactobacillus salitolerans TaxID=1808352 RepID=A0A401ISL5_9LACO|nr:HsdR family type I site-specific deoxyribonuclease [Ligilactobacillus salitolerans]GBG94511.1 type I restriction-modification system restriction subunit R [Ligilactobacillus salitolerans]